MSVKISEPTVERLVHYHRVLTQFAKDRKRVVSSCHIAEVLGIKASQVRKDLSYFGEVGRRGIGYNVAVLCRHIVKILDTPKIWKVAVAGVGHLGKALIGHSDFYSDKIEVVALFDVDPEKIGKEIYGIPCYSDLDMAAVIRDKKIEILILAVPDSVAQSCIDTAAVSKTLKGVLSFASSAVTVPDGVLFYRVDFLATLEKMFFYLKADVKN